jgi:hypothetical protein
MAFIEEGLVDPFAGRKEIPAVELKGEIISTEKVKLNSSSELSPAVIEELKAWGSILNALKDGLPIPNNPIHTVQKIEYYERESGADLSELKKCCATQNEVREAQYTKPYFFAILKRVATIAKLSIKERNKR